MLFYTFDYGLVVRNIQSNVAWTNVWNTLNKINSTAFNDNFNQNGATNLFSERDISKTNRL